LNEIVPLCRSDEAREVVARFKPLGLFQPAARHLLATDVAQDTGEVTIEPAHEALLRRWGLLQGWLDEDFGALTTLASVQRAARDWAANNKDAAWITHAMLGDELIDERTGFGWNLRHARHPAARAAAFRIDAGEPGNEATAQECEPRDAVARNSRVGISRR